MKRAVLLILVLLLLIDLGVDGQLGKAAFESPDSVAKTYLTSPPQYDSSNFGSHYSLLVANYREMPSRSLFQPVIIVVLPALKSITHCHTGKSGGLPL